jgi:hypothetical protein
MPWPATYRSSVTQSNNRALSLKVLGEYTPALHADLIHSRSLLKEQKLQPAPEVGRMIIPCAPFQNLVSDLQSWNEEAKAWMEVKEHSCINLIKHREPRVFDEEEHWNVMTAGVKDKERKQGDFFNQFMLN